MERKKKKRMVPLELETVSVRQTKLIKSQMIAALKIAEALEKHLRGDEFDFYSAGTETKPQINKDALRLMKHIYGIDMEKTQFSKTIDKISTPNIAISMVCDVGCPYIWRTFYDNWGLPDPTRQSDDVFIEVIRQIETHLISHAIAVILLTN